MSLMIEGIGPTTEVVHRILNTSASWGKRRIEHIFLQSLSKRHPLVDILERVGEIAVFFLTIAFMGIAGRKVLKPRSVAPNLPPAPPSLQAPPPAPPAPEISLEERRAVEMGEEIQRLRSLYNGDLGGRGVEELLSGLEDFERRYGQFRNPNSALGQNPPCL